MSDQQQQQQQPQKDYVTIWVDGCFDMMHFGHANAIRQAKTLYPRVKLICGVHTDEEIARHKGPTVMNSEERYAAVRACKWVDEVVEGAPYTTQVDILKQHSVDFCVHGEDISFDENGEDTYRAIKEAGMMKTVKRTDGVSSTDIVNRMLHLAQFYHLNDDDGNESTTTTTVTTTSSTTTSTTTATATATTVVESPYTRARPFLPTTWKIWQFSNPLLPWDTSSSSSNNGQNSDDEVVTVQDLTLTSVEQRVRHGEKTVIYVDGAFDMFHVGHTDFLKRAKQLGHHLVVGVHDDSVIQQHKGMHYPIMNLHERVLSVLSCRYVDDVVIGAPFILTRDLIDSLKVNMVVSGSSRDVQYSVDPYAIARELGIYTCIESPRPQLTTTAIVKRIVQNAQQYESRNAKKTLKELNNLEKFGHKIEEINKDVISN